MTGNYGQQHRGHISLFSVISTPVLIILLATALLVYNLITLIGVLVNGGEIVYEEETINKYVSSVYDGSFKKASAPKSGLAIMFFYNEDTNVMEYTIKAGANVSTYVTAIFATDSKFGTLLKSNVKMESYKTSLAAGLSTTMAKMADEVVKLDLISNFVYNHDMGNMPSSVAIVKDKNVISEENAAVITEALEKFTKETGIPVVMTIDSAVNAFGRKIPVTDILMVVLLIAVIGLCTYNLVKKIRDYNRIKNDFGVEEPNRIHVNARSPYYDEEDDEPVHQEETPTPEYGTEFIDENDESDEDEEYVADDEKEEDDYEEEEYDADYDENTSHE